ncbi:MAG: OmpA family protein [Deltaproteobacteria bacterium]|nr:OmpA family protein [Deltaproteobacteria bacterium]MBW2121588.1 OmpA family protein [Deltaproteobacteria bacterium]
MVHKYGRWIFLVTICLGLAMAGCAPKKKAGIPIGLQAQYDEAKSLFQQATEVGARECAPVEYAEAQVYLERTAHEWEEQDYADAAKWIAVIKQKSMEAIEKCRPKEVPPPKEEVAPAKPAPPPEKPKEAARPSFAFAPVYFDVGKADIRSDAIVVLDRIGMILQQNPWLKIEVAGHSDSGGSEEANMELSLKRAKSVATYLMDHFGISPHRLKVLGYGESRPVADNSTREGRRMNRRVEFRAIEE